MSYDNNLYYSNQLIDINAISSKITYITSANSPYLLALNNVIYGTVTAGAITINLTNNNSLPNQQVIIKNLDPTSTGNNITIFPSTGFTIEGGANYILSPNTVACFLRVTSTINDWQLIFLYGAGSTGLLTTKGDLLTHDGTSEVRLPVGADGYVLTANSLAPDGISWEMSVAGDVTNASNIGLSGIGLFDSKLAGILQFKNIDAGSSKITVTNDAVNFTVDIDINESAVDINNLGGTPLEVLNGGTGVSNLTSGNVLVGNGTSPVLTTKAAPTGDFVGTTDAQILTNKTITDTSNNVAANSLKTLTGVVTVSTAAAPTVGQVLTATSATSADWQDNSANNVFTYSLSNIQAAASSTSYTTINYFPWLNSSYSIYSGGTVTLNATIVNRNLDVRLFDVDNAISLGSLNIISSGSYDFSVINPITDTKIAIQIRKSAAGGVNPTIFGIVVEYS